MEYQDKIKTIKSIGRCNPNLTDRELSIMLDAAFSEDYDVDEITESVTKK